MGQDLLSEAIFLVCQVFRLSFAGWLIIPNQYIDFAITGRDWKYEYIFCIIL